MQLRELATDDDAVSPVIGVILMVAITVILAAVIGAFVLGFGGSTSAAPSASFTVEEADGEEGGATFTHDGGDPIEVSNLYCGSSGGDSLTVDGSSDESEMTAGNSVTCDSGESLVWDDGDSSSTLAEHEGSSSGDGTGDTSGDDTDDGSGDGTNESSPE